MTLEAGLAAITASTTNLVFAVSAQQGEVVRAVAAFDSVTNRVKTGLNQVDNTPDLEKPVSALAQQALDTKQVVLVSGQNISTVNGKSLLDGEPLVIERSATSLNRLAYDARGSLRAAEPEVDDAVVVESLGLFMWVGTQAEPDDDETCFTANTGQWLLQLPAWDLINAWALHDDAVTDDWREDEPNRFAAHLLANK